jgi:hypothetical protein
MECFATRTRTQDAPTVQDSKNAADAAAAVEAKLKVPVTTLVK